MSLFTELKRRNVIRVTAAYVVVSWLVTEVATTLLGTFDAPDWAAKAIVVVLILGFVPVVVFSWVYELTPEGIKKEKEVERDASITAQTGRKLDLITIGAVAVLIAFLGVLRFVAPGGGTYSTGSDIDAAAPGIADVVVTDEIIVTADNASVAVLPFVNMSGNEENQYFSDGLTETLLHMLAQIPDLKVAARTSSFAFKGQQQDVRAIAEALNVAHILEGSVQRAGDRVRITAQLIRADDGFHIWSENYDRTLTDIFAIQDEIANEVGGALAASLIGAGEELAIVGIGTENLAAYEMYLEALHHRALGSYGGLGKAENLLKSALARDPEFNDAKLLLAQVYVAAQNTGLMPEFEALSQASALLAQVVEARPTDIQAVTWQVMNDAILDAVTRDAEAFVNAIPVLQDLVEEAPNEIEPRLWLASNLVLFNQAEEGFAHFEKAMKLDALNPQVHYMLGDAYLREERWHEALNAFQRSLELKPEQPNAWANIGDAKAGMGDYVGYIDGYVRAADVDSQDHELPALIAENLYMLGMIEAGDTFLVRARAIAPASPATRRVNMTRAYIVGDHDFALREAQSMILDDVEDRQGAFWIAVWNYAMISIGRGEADAAFDFLQEQVPGIHDASVAAPLKTTRSRSALFDLWAVVMPDDRLVAEINAVLERSERVGFDPADNADLFVHGYALRGDLDAAVQLGLDTYFSWPLSRFTYWRMEFSEPGLAEVVSDPRVNAEMIRLEQEEDLARRTLREYFARRN